MTFPLWALFGLGAAVVSVGMMLSQERLKVNSYAVSFWSKAACVLVTIPFVIQMGLPSDPLFYVYVGATAVLFAISDVIFYEGISKTNAGAVARLLPVSVIFSFLLWFVFDPALLDKYLSVPFIAGSIFIVLCLSAYFGTRLKKCSFSMAALKAVWFVVFAATIGPLLTKAATLHAAPGQGLMAYVFCQGIMMMALWLAYLVIRRPVPVSILLHKASWQGGLIVGVFAVGSVLLSTMAYYHVDNPGYIPAVRFLDSVLILLLYKHWGRPVQGDIKSGIGLVFCAIALVILKAQI